MSPAAALGVVEATTSLGGGSPGFWRNPPSGRQSEPQPRLVLLGPSSSSAMPYDRPLFDEDDDYDYDYDYE